MKEISNFKIETLENPGCNNGNYTRWTGTVDGQEAHGQTCRCRKGCAGTDELIERDGKVYLNLSDESRQDETGETRSQDKIKRRK